MQRAAGVDSGSGGIRAVEYCEKECCSDGLDALDSTTAVAAETVAVMTAGLEDFVADSGEQLQLGVLLLARVPLLDGAAGAAVTAADEAAAPLRTSCVFSCAEAFSALVYLFSPLLIVFFLNLPI